MIGQRVLLPVAFFTLLVAVDAQQSGKAAFQKAEELLKNGRTTEAYDFLTLALAVEPTNQKFQKKKAEVGAVLSNGAFLKAQALIDTDPNLAERLIQEALRLDPQNAGAKQVSDSLKTQYEADRTRLREAEAAAFRGEVDKAGELLSSLKAYRARDGNEKGLLSFEKADSELRRAMRALQLRQLWTDGKIGPAMDTLSGFETIEADGSFVFETVTEIRSAIVGALVAQAHSTSRENLSGLIQGAELLESALKVDPRSTRVRPLLAETLNQMQSILNRPTEGLKFVRETSAARLHLEIHYAVADLVGDRDAKSAAAEALKQAYPGVTVSVRTDDLRSCLPLTGKESMASEIDTSLRPVATSVSSGSDLEIILTEISCPRVDIPRQSVQAVNSTYVAAQTQLSNPQWVERQSVLASAEANLNRAYAAYQTNPDIANSIVYGRATRQVRDARSALANTPPYTASEVLQAYQYQEFEALRSASFKATVRVEGNPSRFRYLTSREIASSREDRREGVGGVLLGDKSGGTNVEPVLAPIDELVSGASAELARKAAGEVRNVAISYLAARASSAEEAPGDRIAAMLYWFDLSKGTEYEKDADHWRTRLRAALQGDSEGLLAFGKQINLPLAEQRPPVSLPQSQKERGTDITIERVLDGVVSIETDQGTVGTGFFVGPHCHVITNNHVVSGATTIVLKTSQRHLFVGQVLARDVDRDLAILTTNAPECLALELEEANVGIGTEVFAVGNPLGLEGTVTKGIVSAIRTFSGSSLPPNRCNP